jgi:D-glycero-alpha-D-manno-heptose-7-phosphate kinase
LGGALALRFGPNVSAQSIPMSAAAMTELPRRCIVTYTGESRVSATTITAVLGAYRAGNRAVTSALGRMRELAEEMSVALARADFDALGELVGEHWRHQRTLDPAIPTPLIDDVIAKATRAGATGCKALGASGGGCVLMIAPADRAENVRRTVAPLGSPIEFAVDILGVHRCE